MNLLLTIRAELTAPETEAFQFWLDFRIPTQSLIVSIFGKGLSICPSYNSRHAVDGQEIIMNNNKVGVT